VDATSSASALHALMTYLVPLFDSTATSLAVTCPPSKTDALAAGFEEAHGASVRIVPEDQLNAVFGSATDAGDTKPPLTQTQGGKRAAGAFAFAKQIKCECPKCGPAERV